MYNKRIVLTNYSAVDMVIFAFQVYRNNDNVVIVVDSVKNEYSLFTLMQAAQMFNGIYHYDISRDEASLIVPARFVSRFEDCPDGYNR